MKKMYGFKQKDIEGLAQFIKDKSHQSLTETFNQYALINGKATGTIRNLYYAIAKKSTVDKEFCEKYFDGKPLKVAQIIGFEKNEEKELIKKILLAKYNGSSVRGEILRLANGDAKIALRYQNKYRNALKNKPDLINQIVLEIKNQDNACYNEKTINKKSVVVSNEQFEKLKNQIDSLVSKISLKIRKENACLKERIALLERENLKLMTMLYGSNKPIDAKKYFNPIANKQYIN